MMTKDLLIKQITQRITYDFSPLALNIIDDTDKHKKHKHFQQGKYHFRLVIKSDKLSQLSRVKAHQSIYNCLKEEMKYIHALSITLQKNESSSRSVE